MPNAGPRSARNGERFERSACEPGATNPGDWDGGRTGNEFRGDGVHVHDPENLATLPGHNTRSECHVIRSADIESWNGILALKTKTTPLVGSLTRVTATQCRREESSTEDGNKRESCCLHAWIVVFHEL